MHVASLVFACGRQGHARVNAGGGGVEDEESHHAVFNPRTSDNLLYQPFFVQPALVVCVLPLAELGFKAQSFLLLLGQFGASRSLCRNSRALFGFFIQINFFFFIL